MWGRRGRDTGPDTWELAGERTEADHDGAYSPGGREAAASAMPQSALPEACFGGRLGCFLAFDHGVK